MESLRNKNADISNKYKEGKPKIAICIPLYNSVTANWLIQFIRFLKANENKYNIRIYMHEQQPVSESRNSLAMMALANDPEYIFWMDSDNSIPENAIDHLLSTMLGKNADLVTGLYFSKTPPYYPILRKWHAGIFAQIQNVDLKQNIPIDGCGMGCCLVKSEVFKQIEYPYFKFSYEVWGYKDIVLSEDLYFCRQLMQKNKRLYANTGVISGHIGSTVDIMEYNNYKPFRQSFELEREELMGHIVEFTGKSMEEAEKEVSVGPGLMKAAWEKANPKTPQERKQFYKTTDRYIYDLALWHFSNRRDFDMQIMSKFKKLKDNKEVIKVLDVGCGIGQNSTMLARLGIDVTIADLDSVTLKFAEHRFQKNKMPYKIWKMDTENPPEEKYDYIMAFEVFEHIDEDETEKIVKQLIKMKKKDTVIIMSTSFSKDAGYKGTHPMHYDKTDKIKELLAELTNRII